MGQLHMGNQNAINDQVTSGSYIIIPERDYEQIPNKPTPIQYKQCFVAFLDILGFKELVNLCKKEKIDEYFSLIQQTLDELKKRESKKNVQSIIISDTVLLSIEFGSDNYENLFNFRQLCIAVRDIQLNLATHNLWLRGAISHGDAYFSPTKHNVVGKAYQKAYELGESQAIYPRVIIDPTIIDEFQDLQTAQDLIEAINNLQVDTQVRSSEIFFNWKKYKRYLNNFPQDVALFINYLFPGIKNTSSFNLLCSAIQENIYSDQKIYGKYRWVVNYLKVCCEYYKGSGGASPDLLLSYQKLDRI